MHRHRRALLIAGLLMLLAGAAWARGSMGLGMGYDQVPDRGAGGGPPPLGNCIKYQASACITYQVGGNLLYQ